MTKITEKNDKLLTAKEVQAQLSISSTTLWRLIHTGQLSVIRLGPGGHPRIPESALADFIAHNTHKKRGG